MSTHEDSIRAAFIRLRNYCDPRGHGIIDCLEQMMLTQDEGQDALVRTVNSFPDDIFSVRAELLDAYEPDDPKSDGFHERTAAIFDLRERA